MREAIGAILSSDSERSWVWSEKRRFALQMEDVDAWQRERDRDLGLPRLLVSVLMASPTDACLADDARDLLRGWAGWEEACSSELLWDLVHGAASSETAFR